MSFDVIKNVKVIIDGEDYLVLSNICECARRYIELNRRQDRSAGEFDCRQTKRIEGMMEDIWEGSVKRNY